MFVVGNTLQEPNRTLGGEKRPSPAFSADQRIRFLHERSGNVIENKGPLWKTFEQSWNLNENKAT
jgi:hypothetical protein